VTEPNELSRRVDSLESQMRTMREKLSTAVNDAAAARALASGADRDVAEVRSELRAHTAALNALRETQIEQGQQLNQHGRKLDSHSQKLDEHSQKLDEHSQKLDEHSQKLDEHSRILGEHTRMLTDLTRTVHGQGDTLRSHGEMLSSVQAGVTRVLELLTESGSR
jgi:chromosome segregation ATPase